MAMKNLSIYIPSNLLYNEEDIPQYEPGGFPPVSLGDTFEEGRFVAPLLDGITKLGWGGFSTFWLAWDKKYDGPLHVTSFASFYLPIQIQVEAVSVTRNQEGR
jgi:hypothetical protein